MKDQPEIVLVVAAARGNVIGRDGALPWRLPTDLKYFKRVTTGKPVIMGRKTWDSIGRPLPGRTNIVISRSVRELPGAHVVDDVKAALALAREVASTDGAGQICVIGGAQIYQQTLSMADELHVTHVEASVEGDAVFPEIDLGQWAKVSETEVPAGANDSHPMRIAVYRRR